MKKNKLFAFLCCFAALVCTSFLASCGDDDDDKKFDPSAIYGSWELYGRREIIYDKDGKVLSDETYDFKEHIEYYWAYTFSETTWRMDLYKCAIDDLKKFTIDEHYCPEYLCNYAKPSKSDNWRMSSSTVSVMSILQNSSVNGICSKSTRPMAWEKM